MGLIQTQLSVTNLTTGRITSFHKCIIEKCQRLHSASDRLMNMGHWWKDMDRRKLQQSKQNLTQSHIV